MRYKCLEYSLGSFMTFLNKYSADFKRKITTETLSLSKGHTQNIALVLGSSSTREHLFYVQTPKNKVKKIWYVNSKIFDILKSNYCKKECQRITVNSFTRM